MAEYICADLSERPGCKVSPFWERRERVTRCRDCEYATEHRSKSILGNELVTLTCSGPIQGAYSEGADVDPDGFCAWGEPIEGGERR